MATKLIDEKPNASFRVGGFGFFCGVIRVIIIPDTEPLEFYSGETV